MAQPETLSERFLPELMQAFPISEFRTHSIIHKCTQALSASSPELAAGLWFTIGFAQLRLRDADAALRSFTACRALGRAGNLAVATNIGVAHLMKRNPLAAIEELAKFADDSSGSERVYIYGNLAEAFAQMGNAADSEGAFREAVRAADLKNGTDSFSLAVQAAAIGAEADAAAFFKMYISLSEAGANGDMTERHRALLDENPSLARAFYTAQMLDRGASVVVAMDGDVVSDEAAAHALAVYHETASSRSRANAVVMGAE